VVDILIKKSIMGISKNSNFFVSARKHRADDCMDAGGRAMHGAIVENRSVRVVHEDRPGWHTSTELTPQSQKKCLFRDALKKQTNNMRKTPFINLFILIGVLCSFMSNQTFAAVNVTIDRNLVRLNESFQLVFEADSSPDEGPDFSGLEQYFVVLNQSQSNNITIINGDYQRNIKWVLQVMPKQVGDFVIPSIPFGSDKTKPFQITVKPANQSSAGGQDGLIFELKVDKSTVYVQGQILVTLRLMVDRNISGYQMSDLAIKSMDVVIEPLGEVKQYQTKQGGKDYLVLEKQIALFPQQSGRLEIEPAIAEVQMSKGTSSIFGGFAGAGNIRRIGSQSVSIEVLTIASESNAKQWLPATKFSLTEEWQGDITKLVAGEPVTRTITLVAEGLTSAQLPELDTTPVDGIKLYPDKPLLQNQKTNAGMVGIRQQKIALIPTEAGIYTLPEVTIDWWNVNTGQQEEAKIPSRTIKVKAATDSSSSNEEMQGQQPISQSSNETIAPLDSQTEGSNMFWVWLSLLLAVGWIGTVFIWWYDKHRKFGKDRLDIDQPNTDRIKTLGQRKAMVQLSQSCISNNARDTRDNLLVWANSIDTNQSFDNLNQLGFHFGDEFQIQINELNQSLYGGHEGGWKGADILRCCESIAAHLKTTKSTDHTSNLNSLNP
jgi:hypothetical protein